MGYVLRVEKCRLYIYRTILEGGGKNELKRSFFFCFFLGVYSANFNNLLVFYFIFNLWIPLIEEKVGYKLLSVKQLIEYSNKRHIYLMVRM